MSILSAIIQLIENPPYKRRYQEMMDRIQSDTPQKKNTESDENSNYRDRKPVKELILEFFKNHPEHKMPAELVDFLNTCESVETETGTTEHQIKEIPSLYELLERNARNSD